MNWLKRKAGEKNTVYVDEDLIVHTQVDANVYVDVKTSLKEKMDYPSNTRRAMEKDALAFSKELFEKAEKFKTDVKKRIDEFVTGFEQSYKGQEEKGD